MKSTIRVFGHYGLKVTADFAVDGSPPAVNLVPKFVGHSQGDWELKLINPIETLGRGNPTVTIRDRPSLFGG